ncbi:MAG TPA: ribosome biogenesis GTPase Der [Ignavibacteria bacterium]|nr:ribosome biogenesis GTPase Der [Ignavibacteria bacterium]
MKKQLVVIVGRPNVGKSTFFNRLVGKRDAIVHDKSGVTRDRNYGEVEWAGKNFRLIDTGGYVPDSSDQFEAAIREQVEIAIEEAYSIIFMVDVKSGINPMDIVILKMLRNSGKKFYLVVNKVDNKDQEIAATEFYQLGVENYYDISATMGRNIGDFLDVLTEDFPENEDEETDDRLKIAVVGRPNVGKSSLTNALLGYDRSIVTDIPGTTRDSLNSVLKYYGKEVVLIDTAGLRKKKKVKENIEFFSNIRSLKAIGECDVAIVMLDAQFGLETQDQKIIDEAIRWRKGIVIDVNKWDLIEKETNTAKEMSDKIKKTLGSAGYIPIVYTSALTKQRITKLIDISLEIEDRRKKKIPTNVLNDTLLPEINRTPPPTTNTGKEVKIKYVTQVGSNYPVFLFFTNYPKYVPSHYAKFLENTIRKKFGFNGVPITLSFKEK